MVAGWFYNYFDFCILLLVVSIASKKIRKSFGRQDCTGWKRCH